MATGAGENSQKERALFRARKRWRNSGELATELHGIAPDREGMSCGTRVLSSGGEPREGGGPERRELVLSAAAR